MTAPRDNAAVGVADATAGASTPGSPWRPFKVRAFAVIWTAALVSNTGTWLQQVGAGWLMTSLSPSPLLVSLVQAASLLPVFLFALAAGALADIVDRRRMLLAVHVVMAATALLLAALVALDAVTPWLLLAFTFALGAGAAVGWPVWQAVVPHLVPKADLHAAVGLNSVGLNISRAIGPAIAGLLIGAGGIALPFLLNGLSFLAVVAAFFWWKGTRRVASPLPSERLLVAMRAGLRYAGESAPLRAALIRAIAFFFCATAYWALMPLVIRVELGGGPEQFGIILSCIGGGAVAGAAMLSPLRARFGTDGTVVLGTIATAMSMVVFALAPSFAAVCAAGVVAGVAWINVVASLNVSAQLSLPDWMRGRGLAFFQMAVFGGMGLGSVAWGQVAQVVGIAHALMVAAASAIATMLLTWRWRLAGGDNLDFSPSAIPWPEPMIAAPIGHDRGPVLVTVEYRIDPGDAAAFLKAMCDLRGSRRRGGAYAWGVFEDAAAPGRYLEYFMVESWLEHLRQHERVTADDRRLQDIAIRYHTGNSRPRVHHYLAPSPIPFSEPPSA